MNPLSVLYFTNDTVRGGVEEHILTLLRGLDRGLFQPHLVCPPELAAKLRPDLPADVDLMPLRFTKPWQLSPAARLAAFLRRRRIDILHSHQFCSSLLASPIGRLCGVPVIIETPHVREHWRRGWKSLFVIDRLVGRLVDGYVAVSEANARYLVEQKGLSRANVVVIHNGCDLGRFDPSRTAPPGLKASLSFGERDPVLMVVARLEPQKGHRVLLDALPLVRQRFPTVRVLCVGEGSQRDELNAQAVRLGVADAVRFVGYQSGIAEWLAIADLTVLPSFYEGLPLVAVESLAAGRPVVATAVDGTPEVVVDGRTGSTVPPGDAARLAEAVCRLLGDSKTRQAMGRAGRAWAEAHFGQERQVRQTEKLYLDAWERRRARLPRRTVPADGNASGAEA